MQVKKVQSVTYTKHLPHMPLSASVWEHELIGFEKDQLFEFNYAPAIFAAQFQKKLDEYTISLTPRDFYFKIFGGDHLWKIAQEKKLSYKSGI